MAHIKAGGVAKGNKDSISKRLGVKIYGDQKAISGNIIIRQKGTKFFPGDGVKMGSDRTIFAVREGLVKFTTRKGRRLISIV